LRQVIIRLRLGHVRLHLQQRGARLVQFRIDLRRVDLGHQLALFHAVADIDQQFFQVPAGAWINGRFLHRAGIAWQDQLRHAAAALRLDDVHNRLGVLFIGDAIGLTNPRAVGEIADEEENEQDRDEHSRHDRNSVRADLGKIFRDHFLRAMTMVIVRRRSRRCCRPVRTSRSFAGPAVFLFGLNHRSSSSTCVTGALARNKL
jgi:hypothetical protein